MQNVSLTNPYLTEQMDIERKRRLYEALQAQAMEPLQAQPTPAGGFAVPISGTQGMAKIAQALAAGYGESKLHGESSALAKRYASERANTISQALAAGEATPAQPENTDIMQSNKGLDKFDFNPAKAAVPANRTRVYEALAKNQNFPDLQMAGLAGLPKTPEQYTLAPGAQRFGSDNKLLASSPQMPRTDNRPEVLRLQEAMGNMLPTDPARQQIEDRIKQLTTRPDKAETMSQLGRLTTERDALPTGDPRRSAYDQAISAIGRPPQTHITIPQPPVAILGDNGKPVYATREQALGKTPAAGRGTVASATVQKEIISTDNQIQGAEQALEYLKAAKALNNKAMGGFGSGVIATAGTVLPSAIRPQTIDDTRELDNLLQSAALPQLKSIFGGNPTEGERKILLDVQGSSGQTAAVRKGIFDRAEIAIKARAKFAQDKAASLRAGTYFSDSGGVDPAAPVGEAAAAPRRRSGDTPRRRTGDTLSPAEQQELEQLRQRLGR